MRFRKQRIAWSVFWGMVCVLMFLLWMRSYKYFDDATYNAGARGVSISSLRGAIVVRFGPVVSRRFFSQSSIALEDFKANLFPSPYGIHTKAPWVIISLPHWFYVVITAATALLAWFAPSYKRFSLRTVLIATTLVAGMLGLIVWLGQ
jgi:hypothetical protein